MLRQSFDQATLRKCVRRHDFGAYHIRDEDELGVELDSICARSNEDDYSIESYACHNIKGKMAYSISDFGDNLVARKINQILKRIYKVKQSDRSSVIKQVHALASETTPYSVIRTDISRFYESINPNSVIHKIESDGITSTKTIKILKSMYAPDADYSGEGLRRGLAVSSTLSELKMRDFDQSVRSENGVYYYARFVDDIIIFTTDDARELINKIRTLLPQDLNLNLSKTSITYVPCRDSIDEYKLGFRCDGYSKGPCENKQKIIAFLGYRLIFDCHKSKGEKSKTVEIGIASKKVKRIKYRITRSFQDYCKTLDYPLLRRRIQYLTGNFRLPSKSRDSFLMSGIYYNYPLITDPYTDLKSLDSFLRNIIFSKPSAFNGKLRLTPEQRHELKKFSFLHGHRQKLSKNFDRGVMKDIKGCWKYE